MAGAEAPTPADAAMARYAAGDDAVFPAVYDGVAPRLAGYLRRHCRDRAQLEDLVQQTLLHMHRARGTFIPGAAVLPWAFAIARRLLIDASRRRQHDPMGASTEAVDVDPVAKAPLADEEVQARQTAARLAQELQRLPAAQRQAFELVRQEGLSCAQAAEALGTTVTAVKLRAHRAYVALRAVLRDSTDDAKEGST